MIYELVPRLSWDCPLTDRIRISTSLRLWFIWLVSVFIDINFFLPVYEFAYVKKGLFW